MSLLDKVYEHLSKKVSTAMGGQPTESPGRLTPDVEPGKEFEDHDKIRTRIKEHIEDASRVRWAFERLWFRSILYYIGNQWVTWDGRGQRFRERRLVRKWVPKPVTNRYASTLDAVISAVQSVKVAPSVYPSTSDVDDLATAEVAERLLPVIYNEIDESMMRETIANWVVLNGDCFAFPFYDHADTSLGYRLVQHFRCSSCQAVAAPLDFEKGCPACGQSAATEPAVDEEGKAIGTQYPIGKMRVDCLSPLQVYVNQDLLDIKTHVKFTTIRTYSLDTVKKTWPESGQDVQSDKGTSNKTAQYFMEALAHITEDGGYFYGKTYTNRATIFAHVELPSKDFPEGLTVSMAADDTILEVGPCPFFETVGEEKVYYNPLIQFSYKRVPGRLYSRTPAYDLLPKQDQLNRLESLIEMAVMKGVYSTWILPAGSSITNITGEPAQHIKWTPMGTGGAKPEVVTQTPVPPALFQWKEQIQADFEELAGTFDAMKGNVPSGVSAGYAIQLLTERSYGRFGSVFSNWERGWKDITSVLLKLARTYYTEERIRRIRGETGQWEIEKFKGSDLRGAVDVSIEGASARPRSKIAEQALIEGLVKMGVLNASDPNQQYAIAALFGMAHILGGIDGDKRHAAQEWDEFGKGMAPIYRPEVDNDIVHIQDHMERAKSDVFRKMKMELQRVWQGHITAHKNNIIQQQMAMQQAAMHTPSAPSGGGPSGGKGAEMGDQTMNQVRSGGNKALGT